MKEFLQYFFLAGTEAEFALFTPAHFAPILLLVAVIFLIRKNRDALRQWKYEEMLRYVLGFALIISDMAYYWRLVGGAPWLQPLEHSSAPGHEPAPSGLALPSCVVSTAGSQAHC